MTTALPPDPAKLKVVARTNVTTPLPGTINPKTLNDVDKTHAGHVLGILFFRLFLKVIN